MKVDASISFSEWRYGFHIFVGNSVVAIPDFHCWSEALIFENPSSGHLLFSATERPNPENISWSKKWAGPTAGSDRLVRIDSHRVIVHSHGLGKPESAINVAGLRGVWNTNFL
jgi:hypothetical protein